MLHSPMRWLPHPPLLARRARMLARRPGWQAACRASRAISLAAQHRSPTSYLHDLVGDANQPGLLGGYGVKAVALVDVNAGEVIFRELTQPKPKPMPEPKPEPKPKPKPDQVIFREKGEQLSSPSMHSIQTGVERHCQIDGEGRYTAHSFAPNTAALHVGNKQTQPSSRPAGSSGAALSARACPGLPRPGRAAVGCRTHWPASA